MKRFFEVLLMIIFFPVTIIGYIIVKVELDRFKIEF